MADGQTDHEATKTAQGEDWTPRDILLELMDCFETLAAEAGLAVAADKTDYFQEGRASAFRLAAGLAKVRTQHLDMGHQIPDEDREYWVDQDRQYVDSLDQSREWHALSPAEQTARPRAAGDNGS